MNKKANAHNQLNNIFKNSNINDNEFVCALCGKQPVEKHHENYDEPFVFIPLCKKHHNFITNKIDITKWFNTQRRIKYDINSGGIQICINSKILKLSNIPNNIKLEVKRYALNDKKVLLKFREKKIVNTRLTETLIEAKEWVIASRRLSNNLKGSIHVYINSRVLLDSGIENFTELEVKYYPIKEMKILLKFRKVKK